MYWVRSHLRLGSFLALSALVFQLAVSFGHVHLRASPISDPALVVSSALAQTDADAVPSSEPASDEVPAAADHCAVCALVHLAGTVLAAQPPVLPLPVLFGHSPAPVAAVFGLAASNTAPFAARAPPIA
jgi:hypothetical protein